MRMAFDIDVRDVVPVDQRADARSSTRPGDQVCHVENARCLARTIAGARYVELPGERPRALVRSRSRPSPRFASSSPDRGRPEDPDRVLATVLFTDLVGSTARAAELGDRRWRDLLEQHHAAVRARAGPLRRPRGRTRQATASSRRSTGRPGRSAALRRSCRRCAAGARGAGGAPHRRGRAALTTRSPASP